MSRLRVAFLATVVAGAFMLPGTVTSPPTASAEAATVIRFASLAPAGSAFMKVMKAWNRSLKQQTSNRVELRFYSGGSQGDERDFIRKVRAGQMDAAGVTTTGLGMVARPVLVLTAPGLITEYDQLERARTELNDRFSKLFADAGFQLLAWGEAGKNRIFSVNAFAAPEDLKSGRPWAWKDDPVFAEFVSVIGANPVRLGVPEVYPGLQTRMIDIVPASAIGAVALQWYTRLKYMAKDNFGIIVGGSIIKQEKFDQLSEEDQKALLETSERAARALDTIARRDDDRAYRSMVSRGVVEVDTSAHQAKWDSVAAQTRKNLTGRVYSKSLLDSVQAVVANK
ncbi:MAG: TRAP transporter substrate-binding protein DctP [Myxococcota bacterium]